MNYIKCTNAALQPLWHGHPMRGVLVLNKPAGWHYSFRVHAVSAWQQPEIRSETASFGWAAVGPRLSGNELGRISGTFLPDNRRYCRPNWPIVWGPGNTDRGLNPCVEEPSAAHTASPVLHFFMQRFQRYIQMRLRSPFDTQAAFPSLGKTRNNLASCNPRHRVPPARTRLFFHPQRS